MVTTIKLYGALAKKKDMNTIYALVIEEFEKMLSRNHCQIINVSSSDSTKTLLGRNQVVTVIWSGTSSQIKSSYDVSVHYGLFGIPDSVRLY